MRIFVCLAQHNAPMFTGPVAGTWAPVSDRLCLALKMRAAVRVTSLDWQGGNCPSLGREGFKPPLRPPPQGRPAVLLPAAVTIQTEAPRGTLSPL
jgi:hypothetical protein